ncbi:isomerase [Massilia sp. Root418]|jgi:ketosteroid isomerase-like protein|uniref:nuclear transport factor 2 family protein n=1 Tax=Massilia sp. Root418 TaxID=1736532 RepID=UPI0006F3F692|nr:nuclear transport factor 2 family protein [Massilia sp. Root418]KQW93493.1 isomerase [Massilia sp. Root418]
MSTYECPECQEGVACLERVVRFYETLAPGTVPQLREVYTPDAFFKDPFNEVRGHAAIARIFEHMFEQVAQPRFVVKERMAQGGQAFLTWEFHFRMGRELHTIRGASHLAFGVDGRVAVHRDYWDAAEELYEKIPLLGGFMRLLKRRARS